ncbi:hypothetical protein [Delftia tsuruhatensis]|uniref:hypothetical protein n=1 Tax=Delftia tsuruhatensis TaxID=180282 RepID=UPI001F2DC220|nr:hypothetical protein [Delftia tsuruhatensis]
MNKVHSPQESLTTPKPETGAVRAPQASAQPAGTGRVFKFSFKSIPVVDAKMQARLEAAARKPRKDRRFPVMIDPPDA